jgi:hypothetical protein
MMAKGKERKRKANNGIIIGNKGNTLHKSEQIEVKQEPTTRWQAAKQGLEGKARSR